MSYQIYHKSAVRAETHYTCVPYSSTAPRPSLHQTPRLHLLTPCMEERSQQCWVIISDTHIERGLVIYDRELHNVRIH